MRRAIINLAAFIAICSIARGQPPSFSSVAAILAEFEQPDGTIDRQGLLRHIGFQPSLPLEEPTADLVTIKAGDPAWKAIVVSDLWAVGWEYLLFHSDRAGRWSPTGKIDFEDEHFEKPSNRLLELRSKSWLVVGHLRSWGTGFLLREEAWFSLTGSSATCQLRYLSSGWVTTNAQQVAYTLKSVRSTQSGGIPEVTVVHSVQMPLSQSAYSRTLSERLIETRFVWSRLKNRFVPTGPVPDPLILLK